MVVGSNVIVEGSVSINDIDSGIKAFEVWECRIKAANLIGVEVISDHGSHFFNRAIPFSNSSIFPIRFAILVVSA